MDALFGTDGIRGVAGQYPMTTEMAFKVGMALTSYFAADKGRPLVVIGQDTRESGNMLAQALMTGVTATGGLIQDIGVLPTPAVAVETVNQGAAAGVMVSASHNPYQDNGIKIFGPAGFKLEDAQEAAIEKLIHSSEPPSHFKDLSKIKSRSIDRSAADRYVNFLKSGRLYPEADLTNLQVVVDCAHGATFEVAPKLFQTLAIPARVLHIDPNGRNINTDCGSQSPEKLAAAVKADGAHAGLAFDGDGDRVVAVDERGHILTGDVILAIVACHLKKIGRLSPEIVVSTVMSNIGLGITLAEHGIRHSTTDVGDRHVMHAMQANGAILGGEDSGHIIFSDHHTSGDGILAGLRVLEIMAHSGLKLSELSEIITVYPQSKTNVDVQSKPPIDTIPEITQAITSAEKELGSQGRVLVRYSGTQSCCRVMVEGPTEETTRSLCRQIASAIKEQLGRQS